MRYIKVEFKSAGVAFQEVDDKGNVLRYVDDQGAEIFVVPPVNDSCRVVEDDASPTVAMVAASDVRNEVPYNWEKQGDRRSGRGRRSTDQK